MRIAKYQKKSKKLLSAGIASLLIVSSLIGGAFAWSDFTQSRTNRFRGTTEADVTLHDEFDGENKDVFVENSGTSDIYVRVRLDEYMQMGETIFTQPGFTPDAKNKNSWIPHTYTEDDIANCNQAENCKFHSYHTWNMSGAERLYHPGTPGMVYGVLGADGKVDTTTGTNPTSAGRGHVKMSYYMELADKIDASEALTEWEQTIWNNIKAGCWLLDDTDTAANGGAWAYWSVALKPNTATNLLLDEVVRTSKDASDDWIYRIDVKLQAVSATDFGKWDSEPAGTIGYKTTEDAKTLITVWQNSL